ncbi:hypothetical protein GLOTRDRAFT_136383 [Gloeophyllum trabeum ATCC 11539]|uniref:RRM domain-containing protein n=1 Tax=Gloeophyllum trabeum (strain ATCC 11539 / FP-39264 / Madison 617) TaxID=670483 RepID=S7S1C7_GLOTA|nr:uncharacterized protein GLOTRDRAFT_136383 [Gloeophyllum trabeum ATCC 11539]EPQ59534.1 hypothetical protein GLOTRDRAFT_136383 [Gloeophyllum trabeum ATCC 11539]
MGRFGCREICYVSMDTVASSSTSTIEQPSNSPRKTFARTREAGGEHAATPPPLTRRKSLTNMKGKAKSSKKTRSHMTKDNKERVQEAQKKDRMKTRKTQTPTWLYVGNLHPATTSAQIRQLFRSCGRIIDASCRVTRGTIGAQSKHWNRKLRAQDRVYAAILFADAVSALRAHGLDGTVLNDLPMVVCFNATDLPDAQEISQPRDTPHAAESTPPSFIGPKLEGLWQRITREKTERVKFPDDPKADPIPRNKVMGMSMPLTIA